MASQWYVSRDGQRKGPYSADELNRLVDEGRVRGADLVWCAGMADWVEAKKVLQPPARRAEPPPPRRREEEYYDERAGRYDEETEDLSAARSQFPGRMITPGFFFLAILLFLLPWVDVRCNGVTVVSQSGLQASFGGYSEDTLFLRQQGVDLAARFKEDRVKPAPMMIVYGALIVGGLILGLALTVGVVRLTFLGAIAAAAVIVMVAQLGVGFPIQEQAAKANADQQFQANFQKNNPFAGMGIPAPVPNPFFAGPQIVTVGTTPWFWLALLITLGVGGGLALEHCLVFAPRRRRLSRY